MKKYLYLVLASSITLTPLLGKANAYSTCMKSSIEAKGHIYKEADRKKAHRALAKKACRSTDSTKVNAQCIYDALDRLEDAYNDAVRSSMEPCRAKAQKEKMLLKASGRLP